MRKVIVYHGSYGCDTGCCGHWIAVDNVRVEPPSAGFDFVHYDEEVDAVEWAKQFVEDNLDAAHAADLDWANCVVLTRDECGM